MYVTLLTWQFRYWLLIGCIKISAIFKNQQFEDSRSEKTELKGLKCQQLYMRTNEEGKSLDKFESEDEGKVIGYILFFFVALLRKESNYLTDMGKRIRSLNYLI